MPEFETMDGALTLTLEGSAVGAVANNLNTTEEGYALDARQGYVLDQKKLDRLSVVNNRTTLDEGFALDARQGKWLDENKLGFADVANNLTTDDQNRVLSAAQGVKLRTLAESKLDAEAVVNSLTSSETDKALSAAQGKALKTLVDGKASASAVSVALPASGWSDNQITVSVSGVKSDNIIIVTSAPASYTLWRDCGVYCLSQAEGSLTFKATTLPGAALTAQVLIIQ